jgi:F420 biosynthesis protein FbiB-like protein
VGIPEFLEARRSIRAFTAESVPRATLDALIEAGCIAPAPHHSRPWRWVVVDTVDAKRRLAEGMGDAWRDDLAKDGVARARVDALVAASSAKIAGAPAVVLGCLTWDGLDRYPDERRRRAEWGMALLSLGAAVENLMLATPRPATPRAGSRHRSSAPRPPATRSPSPTSGSPTPWCWSGAPTPRMWAVPARRSRSTPCAPTAEPCPSLPPRANRRHFASSCDVN